MSRETGSGSPTHSFGRALFQILVLGILLPTGLIWAVGQVTTRAAIGYLWDGLSAEITQHSVERTLRFIETGNTALEYNAAAVAEEGAAARFRLHPNARGSLRMRS